MIKRPVDLRQPASLWSVLWLAADAHFLHNPVTASIAVLYGFHHAFLMMHPVHALHLVTRHVLRLGGDAGGKSCGERDSGSKNEIAHFGPHVKLTPSNAPPTASVPGTERDHTNVQSLVRPTSGWCRHLGFSRHPLVKRCHRWPSFSTLNRRLSLFRTRYDPFSGNDPERFQAFFAAASARKKLSHSVAIKPLPTAARGLQPCREKRKRDYV